MRTKMKTRNSIMTKLEEVHTHIYITHLVNCFVWLYSVVPFSEEEYNYTCSTRKFPRKYSDL